MSIHFRTLYFTFVRRPRGSPPPVPRASLELFGQHDRVGRLDLLVVVLHDLAHGEAELLVEVDRLLVVHLRVQLLGKDSVARTHHGQGLELEQGLEQGLG